MLTGLKTLKSLRLEAGVSVSKIARHCDLDRGTVATAEAGRPVAELTAVKIAKGLSSLLERRIDVKDIFSESE